MKNITLSAKEEAIESARQIAAQKNSTLNEMFREWLDEINSTGSVDLGTKLDNLWKETSNFKVGKKLSREEMNVR